MNHQPDLIEIAAAITLDTIRDAAARISGHIVRTPLLESPRLNDALGFRLLVKPECLQHTGSFKLRGATNAVMSLDESVTDVVAFSSGNHAQAVARAASLRGMKATIVMPEDAPEMKIEGTAAYGGHVVTYDRYTESREEIGVAVISDHLGAVARRRRLLDGRSIFGHDDHRWDLVQSGSEGQRLAMVP